MGQNILKPLALKLLCYCFSLHPILNYNVDILCKVANVTIKTDIKYYSMLIEYGIYV